MSELVAIEQAKILSDSALIPKSFQGRPGDVLVALGIAKRLDLSAFEVLNALTIINGRPTFAAQFVIALANTRGPFATRIQFKSEGTAEALSITAFAKMHDGTVASATTTMEMARREGWTKNPKYFSMPEHMLRYRAATYLVRQFCPEILLGLSTKEEIEDVHLAKDESKKAIEALNAKASQV